MENSSLSLYELNSRVRGAVRDTFPDGVWVHGEISEIRTGSGGHCYLELIEKDRTGRTFIAKARAVMWANVYGMLREYFESVTGQPLAAGMKVQVFVTVDMHEFYGYSLTISDIEPAYTLGEQAMLRKEIIARLEKEGVINLNKELEMPRLPNRIAVISSASAAGYGDFRDQLLNNSYGLKFSVELFPAVMQGDRVEASIISALGKIYERAGSFDAVVIIRGGGATADLMGFDRYELASHCAQFPIPIISGIGHERDDTVVDMVAWLRVKTPTAAAQWFVNRAHGEQVLLGQMQQRMCSAVSLRLERERALIARMVAAVPHAASAALVQEGMRISYAENSMRSLGTALVADGARRLQRAAERIGVLSSSLLSAAGHRVEQMELRLHNGTEKNIIAGKNRLELLSRQVEIYSPDNILRKGYAMVRRGDAFVKRVADAKAGDILELELADGRIKVEVKETVK